MTHTAVARRNQGNEGQALAEFALVVPVFFLLLFAVIQFGILLGGQIGLTNGTREAARYASTIPNATTVQIKTELTTRALPKAVPGYRAGNLKLGLTTVSFCSYANPNNTAAYPSYSRKVRVTSVYGHALFVPFVGIIVDRFDSVEDGMLTATVTEEMRVENPRLTTTGGLATCP